MDRMGIQDLEGELHKHDAELRESHPKSEFSPEYVDPGRGADLSKKSDWNVRREPWFEKYRKELRWSVIAVGAIAFVALLGGTFVRIQQSLFSDDRVRVVVSGPDNVNSSDLTHFTISYENANRSGIRDAELVVSYPPNFSPEGNENTFRNNASSSAITIGDISAFGTGKTSFSGKFYGSKNSVAYLRATLRYKPHNLESQFSTEGQKSVNLRTSSLVVELDAPLSVSPQGEVTYLVNYENASDVSLSNVRLKATYPAGFSFVEAAPKPSEGDAVWYVGSIPSGERGSIRITGMLDGVPNEMKVFRAELGTFQGDNTFLSYSDVERTTRMVAPPFGITQSINGAAPAALNPGDDLRYAVSFKNNSPTGLREVIITVELDGEALDYSRLRPEGGAYDSERKVIVWKASDVPSLANLAPNKGGEVKFTVPVRADLLPETTAAKNFRVKTVAKIESPDIPNPAGANKIVATNTANVKVNSRILLESLAVHEDGKIPNEGPIPPKVGETTTYTINWRLSNTTNDVTSAEVSADLPTGAAWTGKTFPETETISYNERTNRVVWNVGSMGVGEGTLSSKREVRFQVSIRPEVNQVGDEAPLLGGATAKATDVFTNEVIQSVAREKTTSLRDDGSVSPNGYKVVP